VFYQSSFLAAIVAINVCLVVSLIWYAFYDLWLGYGVGPILTAVVNVVTYIKSV